MFESITGTSREIKLRNRPRNAPLLISDAARSTARPERLEIKRLMWIANTMRGVQRVDEQSHATIVAAANEN